LKIEVKYTLSCILFINDSYYILDLNSKVSITVGTYFTYCTQNSATHSSIFHLPSPQTCWPISVGLWACW